MRLVKSLAAVCLASLVLAGCSSSDSNDDPAPSTATTAATAFAPVGPMTQLAVVHAAPDAPSVNVAVNGSEVLSAVPYGVGSALLSVSAGNATVQVDGVLNTGPVISGVIGPADIPLSEDTNTYVLAVGTLNVMDTAVFGPRVVEVAKGLADTANVKLTIIHAAPSAPAVDVYASAPGAIDLGTKLNASEFAFDDPMFQIGPVEVPGGDYRIRVTLKDTNTVVFDSGTVNLPAGAELLVAAIQNFGPGSPVDLLVLDGANSSVIESADNGAAVRAVHNAADIALVDVIANGAVELFGDVDFTQVSLFRNVDVADYQVRVTLANMPSAVGIPDTPVSLGNGDRATAIAVGTLTSADSFAPELIALADDVRGIDGVAKVRVVHGSTLAGTVDVYVTGQGTGLGGATPTVDNLDYKAVAPADGYLEVLAGPVDISVTGFDNQNVAIGPLSVTLEGGKTYTIVARDPLNLSGDPGLIFITD